MSIVLRMASTVPFNMCIILGLVSRVPMLIVLPQQKKRCSLELWIKDETCFPFNMYTCTCFQSQVMFYEINVHKKESGFETLKIFSDIHVEIYVHVSHM